jgi:site-specific DNA recombinase
MRCAIYARFSNERQSPTSIADQIRKCREYAERMGWVVIEDHIYTDEAVSGTSMERGGLKRLLECATSPHHAFDCILVDDTSRLSRRLADALNIYDRLAFIGVRVVAVSQGVDTESPQAELLAGVHGLIDSAYSKELAQKTHRGMQGNALKGLSIGGRCFGYQTVAGQDGKPRSEIKRDEADIVAEIYKMYASGNSYRRIAHNLNERGVQSPKPQKGRVNRSWCTSSVRVILQNQRYLGKIVWNTRRKVRVPGTGKRVYRPRPQSEWVVTDAPNLRIIPPELYASVRRRVDKVKELWGRSGGRGLNGQQRQTYLFSGLLRCGVCGGPMILVAGRAGNARAKYGCCWHHQRGDKVCSNGLLIAREELETRMLSGFQEAVLREEVIEHIVKRFEKALQRRAANVDDELARMRKRKAALQTEVANLAQAIAKSGYQSPAIMEQIAEREKELRLITDELVEPRGSVRTQIRELRAFALGELGNIKRILSAPENITQARAKLVERVGTFTLEPVKENGKLIYMASGKVDFFGGAHSRVKCAGGQS